MKQVTDPELLRILNGEEVTDPALLEQLNKVEFDAGTMVDNIPSSALNAALDMTAPIRQPITFSQNFGNLVTGIAEKSIPGEQEHEKYADAAGQYYKDRFGGWDNIKNTAMKDPIGLAMDVSGIGAIMPWRKGAQALRAVDPVNLTKNTVKTGIKALTPKGKPAEMYESAAKFSTTIPKKKRAEMTQTALDNNLPPNAKGVERLDDMIGEIDAKIESLIAEATDNGGQVPAERVFENLPELKKDMGSAVHSDPMGNLDKINSVQNKIEEGLFINNKQTYTVAELQQLKRNLYKEANFDVKQGKADPAVNQARKNIANKAKTLIEDFSPSIRELNQRYGKLIELQEPLTRSANRIDNRNLISINQPLNTGAAYGVTQSPEVAVATSGITALGNPKVKPQVAIWLNKLQKQGLLDLFLDNSAKMHAIRSGLLQSERASDSQPKQ